MALGTVEILENAAVCSDLQTAPQQTSISPSAPPAGSANTAKIFSPQPRRPRQISESGPDVCCALLLGRRHRPGNQGPGPVSAVVTIPTHDAYPSMNLSHHLAVLLYEVSLKSDLSGNFHDPCPQTHGPGKRLKHCMPTCAKPCWTSIFWIPRIPDHLLRTFRRLFGGCRADFPGCPDPQGLMSRIDWTKISADKRTKPSKPRPDLLVFLDKPVVPWLKMGTGTIYKRRP